MMDLTVFRRKYNLHLRCVCEHLPHGDDHFGRTSNVLGGRLHPSGIPIIVSHNRPLFSANINEPLLHGLLRPSMAAAMKKRASATQLDSESEERMRLMPKNLLSSGVNRRPMMFQGRSNSAGLGTQNRRPQTAS